MPTVRPTTGPSARVELMCLYCGHALGDVTVAAGRRPTNVELRAAYASSPGVTPPAWDAHGEPRCPRCKAKLFMEMTARRARMYAEDGFVRRPTHPEEREDQYEREDVYVAEAETAWRRRVRRLESIVPMNSSTATPMSAPPRSSRFDRSSASPATRARRPTLRTASGA